MLPLESKIETDFCNWLRDEYPRPALAEKLILFSGGGFPDRTILCRGSIFFIEFKRPKKGLNPLQVKWKKILERLGFTVYVCTSFRQAKKITIKHLEGS